MLGRGRGRWRSGVPSYWPIAGGVQRMEKRISDLTVRGVDCSTTLGICDFSLNFRRADVT